MGYNLALKAVNKVVGWYKGLTRVKKILLGVGIVGGIGLGIMGKVYKDVDETIVQMHEEVVVNEVRKEAVDVGELEPISVLLLGIDNGAFARGVESGRSDTIMVLTINPEDGETNIVSIPRDTYVKLHDSGEYDKINHAYAFGGIENTINTVQDYLNIPIDYYVSVNMQGLVDIIDAIGGIEVESEFAFDFWDSGQSFSFGEGTISLDGYEALGFARMRYEDPEGDTGRQKRQQKVIEGIMQKLMSLDTISNYKGVLEALGNNVKMNVSLNEMLTLQKGYLGSFDKINKIVISDIEPTYIDAIYYSVVPEETRVSISEQLRQSLRLSSLEVVSKEISDTKVTGTLEDKENTLANSASLRKKMEQEAYEESIRSEIAASISKESVASANSYSQQLAKESIETASIKAAIDKANSTPTTNTTSQSSSSATTTTTTKPVVPVPVVPVVPVPVPDVSSEVEESSSVVEESSIEESSTAISEEVGEASSIK